MMNSDNTTDIIYVYIVTHHHLMPDDTYDIKLVGFYENLASARGAAKRSSIMPGFIDAPDGFKIDMCPINTDFWKGFEFTNNVDNN